MRIPSLSSLANNDRFSSERGDAHLNADTASRFHVFTHRLLRPEHEVSLLPVFIPPSAFLVQRAFQCHASSCGLKVLHADAFRELACPHTHARPSVISLLFSRVSIATLSNLREIFVLKSKWTNCFCVNGYRFALPRGRKEHPVTSMF